MKRDRKTPFLATQVGGGALTRWPPSAAQTARTHFGFSAFTKTQQGREAREGDAAGPRQAESSPRSAGPLQR
jgi:hypothetical protein